MLVLPSDRNWNENPPASVVAFRDLVAGCLEGWDVELTAYDNDAPDAIESISAAVRAQVADLQVSISRHAGSDTVLVQFGDFGPIPFEDLAVAMGVASLEDLIAHMRPPVNPNQEDLCPFIGTGDALRMLNTWRCNNRLSTLSSSKDFRAELSEIATQVHKAAGFNESTS